MRSEIAPNSCFLGAWASLFWVAFADLYVLLCSKGIWVDFRIIGA